VTVEEDGWSVQKTIQLLLRVLFPGHQLMTFDALFQGSPQKLSLREGNGGAYYCYELIITLLLLLQL
jgi:hypothetical protein